jgi:hypothetical protein
MALRCVRIDPASQILKAIALCLYTAQFLDAQAAQKLKTYACAYGGSARAFTFGMDAHKPTHN